MKEGSPAMVLSRQDCLLALSMMLAQIAAIVYVGAAWVGTGGWQHEAWAPV
ncbi:MULTISPECIES: hypothetical protein [Sorangium]|uniref:hypothetical protein n=1 Tax=Sorangium TaxID=39643 RepID=UPI003D9C3BAB